MADSDDPDPAAFIVGVVLLAIIFLALLRCCDSWCKKLHKSKTEDDVEHLDPSIEIKSGFLVNRICATFSCCAEISGENECQQRNVKEGEEQRRENGTVPNLLVQDHVPLPNALGDQQQVARKSVDISNINVALKYLQRQQQTEQTESSTAKLTRIRLVQNLLQLDKANRPTEENMEAALIIGVDATPKVLGGYCVNLREMRIDYYVIKMEDFPWPVENLNDPVEFEMKNLLFALAIWSESIRRFKRFRVYTDNNGIRGLSDFGKDAEDLITHFTNCEDAVLVNKNEMYVNRIRNLGDFAKYIQPADDLSRWQVDKAVDFLCKLYGMNPNRVKGTVRLTRHGTTDTKPWYDPSDAYQEKIEMGQLFAYKFHCENCDINVFG